VGVLLYRCCHREACKGIVADRAVHCGVELLNYAGHSGCRSPWPRVFPRVVSLPAIGQQLSMEHCARMVRGWD